MSGWFAVKRGITSHSLFAGRPDRLAIWLWLLDNAAWKSTTHDVGGATIRVPRGSLCTSERRIASECGVGYQVVRTFLARLKTEQMINAEVTQGRSLITICNWDKYQAANADSNAGDNAAPTQHQRTKETRKQNTPSGHAASPPADLDILNASVWQRVKPYLASHGVSNPGGLITTWLRENKPYEILIAASEAQKKGTENPVPYIKAILKKRQPEADVTYDTCGLPIREYG